MHKGDIQCPQPQLIFIVADNAEDLYKERIELLLSFVKKKLTLLVEVLSCRQ